MRCMFDDNDVVHVVAPTGMVVFNVLGETLHRFAGLDWGNTKKGMTNGTMKKLQNMVAIMMDERSMLSQIILGLVEQAVARSAHECGHSGEDSGGIPVMILFGDYYQLPSIGNGGSTNIPQLNVNSGTKELHDMTAPVHGPCRIGNGVGSGLSSDRLSGYIQGNSRTFASWLDE
jgi:hypothetical protein